MDRRSFFKVVGGAGVAIAVPALAEHVVKKNALPRFDIVPVMREVVAYDISGDRMLARYDILCGVDQIHVDSEYKKFTGTVEEWLEEASGAAKVVLGNEVRHRRGMVRALPLPPGECYRARLIFCPEWSGWTA